jgi:hypothetical protein
MASRNVEEDDYCTARAHTFSLQNSAVPPRPPGVLRSAQRTLVN